ncbi:uncharacterized protein STEHIDRAFT_162130 [Stereum hirsutum FP-91666 SS1]|uniref:uncharacterized protein n=1 Tax=Stereum hirsutum (strain FP-91666) TaxID=721885 RepID=UPI0004449A58|nr:uncharacterized protein STEHIDRAFT_162130 [Stereum hirsutum FP-91666 SS1]EIM81138.1 hypothetical protein STEHIDRAFT_162130 [Stereum hirsutum FP-91666 SS1]
MVLSRKRALSLDSSDFVKPTAKRVCRQWLPQYSPAQTKVDCLDTSRSLTPSAPIRTVASTTSSLSSPDAPPLQVTDKSESPLLLSPSSPFECLSPSLSPASLLLSLTPPSSPPTVASVSSPHTVPNALLSSENAEALPTCSFANDVTADEEARLTARFQDDFRRIWAGSLTIMQASTGFYDLIVRLGLWTGTRKECVTLTRAHPDLAKVFHRVLDTGDFHEISSHPAFHNPLSRIIDKVICSVDHVFASIRGGNLPSTSFPPTSVNPRTTSHLEDLDGPNAASDILVAEELMYMKRGYITATSTRKTRLLLQGLLQYWGLYFSFSTTSAQNQAGIPSTSPDLAFALKLLRRLRASAAAGVDTSHLVDKVFYALCLSRILVLYHFLDSLPSDVSESQAHREWLYFQLAPPRTSAGVDIFTAVLEGIAGGDVDDLRMIAERILSALGWRNHQWFTQSLYGTYAEGVEGGFFVDHLEEVHPPLYLVVDEIEMPVSEGLKPRAARRAARMRAEVYSLLCRPDSS